MPDPTASSLRPRKELQVGNGCLEVHKDTSEDPQVEHRNEKTTCSLYRQVVAEKILGDGFGQRFSETQRKQDVDGIPNGKDHYARSQDMGERPIVQLKTQNGLARQFVLHGSAEDTIAHDNGDQRPVIGVQAAYRTRGFRGVDVHD